MARKNKTKPDAAWLADSPFNLLVDYYTEVPFRPYGSGATRENVLPVLKELKPGYLVIYAKGHSGYTTFPSSLGTEHKMLAKDMPAFFREVTRETGTRLFIYYSGLVDGIAGTRHPEWCMKDREGKVQQILADWKDLFVCYSMCPLSPYFDEWVSVHLEEIFERADPDGIWVDGDWPGPCCCERCQERFHKETGLKGPIPEMDLLTDEGLAWSRTWANITHEWRTRFAAKVKALKPSCLYSAGNISARKEFIAPFDWRSGDWFSPNNHRIVQSIIMRRYATQGMPYDAFTCDTAFVHSRKHYRARTKPLARMLQEGAGVMANGGLWGYWTYPMPNGAFVPSKMRRAAAAAKFARERADVCLHTDTVRWTAVLDAEPRGQLNLSANALGAAKALITLHRSPDVIDESELAGPIPYELIVVPEQPVLGAETVARFERFVRLGGGLLSTGRSIRSPELQELLGVRLAATAQVDDGHVILADGDPAGVFAPWDKLELAGAEQLYPLYLSWDQFNPEVGRIPSNYAIHGMLDEEKPEEAYFPAATVRRLGRGVAVHVPTALFRVYWQFGNPDMLAWLRELLGVLHPHPWFRTDALSFVEVALRRKGRDLLVHFVNGNPGRDMSVVWTDDLWVDDIPAVGPITCWLRCSRKPGEASLQPGGQRAETTWDDGLLKIVLPRLEIHACLVVREWFGG